ncbi:MAG: DUF6599 family protein [Spirochaetota bacterium]
MNFSKGKIWSMIAAGLFLVVLSVQAQSGLNSYLPLNDEIKGWLRDGEAATAANLSTLTMLIDGAAPQYIDLGVQEVIFQDYAAADNRYLTLEIYRTRSPADAVALYAGIYLDEAVVVPDTGDAARLSESLPGTCLLELRKNSFFIRITALSKTEDPRTASLQFARAVSKRIEKAKP